MEIAVQVPVVEATLLEDRAQVTRRATLAVPAGTTVLMVAGVSPVLADKTVAATVAGCRVLDVRVERESVVRTDDPRRDSAALRARLHEGDLAIAQLEADEAASEREGALLAACAAQLAVEINQDAAAGRSDGDGWAAAAEQYAARELAAALRRVELQERLARARREADDLRGQLTVAAGPEGMVARLLITIDAAAAVAAAAVAITYVVPGACWRPWHRARIDAGKVDFACEACVWQRTGEPWNDVRLRLSTDRPSLGVEPPRLSDDPLTLRTKERQVVVESRDQTVESTGGAGGRPADEMPGIDDGGEVRVLAVDGLATVPSDGRPHRFPLFSFTAPAEAELVIHGELAAAAILKSIQANPTAQPLLAGPVDLIRNGGLVGRASILYVAPGARFDLGWGPDAALRVHRHAWSQDEKPGLMSSWQATLHSIDLAISNLSGESRTLRVVERIPVSEVEQIRIELDPATAPATKPDTDGMCSWTVTLPPRGHVEVKLRWRLLKQGTVVGV